MVFNFKSKSVASDISNDIEKESTINFWTGFILLIAVGTLLYITLMHILPEVYAMEHNHPHEEHDNHEHRVNDSHDIDEKSEKSNKPSRGVQVVTLLAGLLTAELLAFAPHPH